MTSMANDVRTRLEAKIMKMNDNREGNQAKVTAEQLFNIDPHIKKDPDSFELNSDNQLHNVSTRVILQIRETSPDTTGLGDFIEMGDFNSNYEISKIPDNALKVIDKSNEGEKTFIGGMMLRRKDAAQDSSDKEYLLVYAAEDSQHTVGLNAAMYNPSEQKITQEGSELFKQYDINPTTLLPYNGENGKHLHNWQRTAIGSALTPDNIRRHITSSQVDNIVDHAMKNNPNYRLVLLANGIDPDNDEEIEVYNEQIGYVPPVDETDKANYLDDPIMKRKRVFNEFIRASGDDHLTDEFNERDLRMISSYIQENRDSINAEQQLALSSAIDGLSAQDTVATRQLTASIESIEHSSETNTVIPNEPDTANDIKNEAGSSPKHRM